MVKKTTSHSLTINLIGGGNPITVSDATAALTALEQFKQGVTVVVPSGQNCKTYIPFHAILSVQDCPTVTSEEVTDALCEERTPAEESGGNGGNEP